MVAAVVFSCSCNVKIRDATQEERLDVKLRDPDPRDLQSLRRAGQLIAGM